MPDLLLEVGCEELPASFVANAAAQLAQEVASRLAAAGLKTEEIRNMATPRRLIVSAKNVPAQQADSVKESRGPGIKAAYDAEGKPTKALEGFCRGQGVDVSAVYTEGDYVYVRKEVVGLPAAEVLQTLLPEAIRALTFEKSMRWGASRMRFARPIRWIVALLDQAVVPFSVETVTSGKTTKGHRFYNRQTFEVTSYDDLIAKLRAASVEPDPHERHSRIVREANAVSSGTPEITDALLDENVYLTEWPTAIEGSFNPEFLTLPEPVLITAMAKHEKFFPVRDKAGKLTNKFISIRNAGTDDAVRGGNEWVLNARFNDAKFFFDEDQKSNLEGFLAQTERMTYQEQLGSVRARVDRLIELTPKILIALGREGLTDSAKQAARLCKADLACGLVGELPALQGLIGAEYARREGVAKDVCDAIGAHYDLGRATALIGSSRDLALALIAADQLDKLAGYLGLGHAPTGSSDPFALRRAVTLLIEIHEAWGMQTDWQTALGQALGVYRSQGIALNEEEAHQAFGQIFDGRYRAMMAHARYDALEGATAASLEVLTNPAEVRRRVEVLSLAAENTTLIQALSRPLNIVRAAEEKGIEIQPQTYREHLDSAEALALDDAVPAESSARKPREVVSELTSWIEPINRFFDSTMIMVEDAQIRAARLGMLKRISQAILRHGDFTRIVSDGPR